MARRKGYLKEYRIKNKEKMLERERASRDTNKEKIKEQYENYCKRYPMRRLLKSINGRCNNPNYDNYKNYGKKGIKNNLTEDDLKFLWERDSASKLKRASIDRVNPKENYSLENCRFIELSENSSRANSKTEIDGKILCPDCEILKEREEFSKDHRAKLGKRTWCRPCYNKRQRDSRQTR